MCKHSFLKKEKIEISVQSNVYDDVYIPERFKNTILKHLILNYSKDINNFSPPLLLAIQGAKGEGKSFMIKKLCEYYSINYIPISGAELCGNLEGDSIKVVMEAYEKACINAAQERKLNCLVIDDFHKSLAANQQKNMSRTTNSETLIGRLMNLADEPFVCGNRVPIILTGNNFTTVYSALTRHKRMDFFDWEPNLEEKINIVYNMFKKYSPDMDYMVVKAFVEKYKNNYVAFFDSVIQDIFWGNCINIIKAFDNSKGMVDLDNITNLVVANLDSPKYFELDNIISHAEKRNLKKAKNFD